MFTGAYMKVYGTIQNALKMLYGYGSAPTSQFTVAVEGNIASGKTSLLEYFQKSSLVDVHMEPVKKWRDVRGHNALAKMYENPSRWALTFQTYVQLTMLETHTAKQTKPVKLMERSIYSAKYCFVENLYKSGKMPEIEYIVLSRWFDFIIANENCHLDLIVYLRASPETILDRIKSRGRKEEKPIPIDYLENLHTLHEDWLVKQVSFPLPKNRNGKTTPILILDANQDRAGVEKQYELHKPEILCGV